MPVLVLIFCITLADQATKLLVRRFLGLDESIEVIPGFFDLIHVRNTGAAFGSFRGLSNVLAVFSLIVLAVLVVYRKSFYGRSPAYRLAFALIAGGILGNLLDRLRWGYVIDFLDFYWKNNHFPAFNVADCCICIGVGLYLLLTWTTGFRKESK